jgi:hypothetical protein
MPRLPGAAIRQLVEEKARVGLERGRFERPVGEGARDDDDRTGAGAGGVRVGVEAE